MMVADNRTETDRQVWIALAVSVSMHVLLLGSLGLGVAAGRASLAAPQVLRVELAGAEPVSAADPSRSAIHSPVSETPQPTMRSPAPTLTPEAKGTEAHAPISSSATLGNENPAELALGHVDVSTTSTLARLGEALAGRSLSEFMPEVEKPVRPASPLAMAYPPAALEARREGSVLAWVHVDIDGSVKEVEIVDGEPDLADSVRESLMRARFLPAEAHGGAVPHFIILQFDFRIGSRLVTTPTDDLGERPLR